MSSYLDDESWIAPLDNRILAKNFEFVVRIQKRIEVLLSVVGWIHEEEKITGLFTSIVQSKFHLDLDVDPTMVWPEHHVGEWVEIVVHAEVHVVMEGVVRSLQVSVARFEIIDKVSILLLIVKSIAELIVRNECVVGD